MSKAVPCVGVTTGKGSHPNVCMSIQVNTSDLLIPALIRADLDMVLGCLPDQFQSDELEIELVEGEPMSIVARVDHPLFDLAEITLHDLVGEAWILHPSGSPVPRRDDTQETAGHAPSLAVSLSAHRQSAVQQPTGCHLIASRCRRTGCGTSALSAGFSTASAY